MELVPNKKNFYRYNGKKYSDFRIEVFDADKHKEIEMIGGETLEEAAKNHINNDLDLYESLIDGHVSYNIGIDLLNNLFINGAKWQADKLIKK
jgi:hypothetical protein